MNRNSRDFIITNYKYFIIFAMLGVVMYWTAIVVEPTIQIAEQNKDILNATAEQNDLMIEQNQKIIEDQNNSSESIKTVIQQIEGSRQNQVDYLFAVLNQSNVIGNATADLILESIANVQELEDNQTKNSKEILKVLAENRNITLSENPIGNGFGLFRSAALVARENIEPLQDIENQTGNVSGYLGGPVIVLNETNTIPSNQSLNASNSNVTS